MCENTIKVYEVCVYKMFSCSSASRSTKFYSFVIMSKDIRIWYRCHYAVLGFTDTLIYHLYQMKQLQFSMNFSFLSLKKKKQPKNKKEANKTSCLQVFNNIFRNMLRKLR